MIRIAAMLMALVMAAGLMAGRSSALESTPSQRFALAISGGASKGAYEAGLNWAALKLVRNTEHVTPLSGGEFRRLEVTSAAGASAGGVNTILSGLTWCARPEDEGGIPSRIDHNVFYDTWLRMDINSLLPPNPDSEIYLPDDAVFSRKDYFAAADELRDLWNTPAFRVGCSVSLGVTVTRVEPQELRVGDIEVKNQRFYIPFELRVKEDGSVGYFFDPADYPQISDPAMILMPRPRGDPPFSISDERVIEAAVTTSAFPTALGRRRLQYCHLAVHSVANAPTSDTQQSETDLICPKGYLLDEAEFADGGLFDNLPIGLARTLAESNTRAIEDPFPVTYFYIDPDRIRDEAPEPPDKTACASDSPPEACRIMEFSFFTESSLLLGALGTARKYELYRETTSDYWLLNLSQLSYELARILEEHTPDFDCRKELPYFDTRLPCTESLRRAGRLLEIAYDRIKPEIFPPYSTDLLVKAGIADNCVQSSTESGTARATSCQIKIRKYRDQLTDALTSISNKAKVDDQRLLVSISRSRETIHNDRSLRVSSRGGPITGTMLGDFASFLDFKFREYDYYVGVYDALVYVSLTLCSLNFPRDQQPEKYARCVDRLGQQFYNSVGVRDTSRARYVFARLAEREFGKDGLFGFAYSPLPPVDRDMQIIHDGVAKALEAGEEDMEDDESVFVTEDTFFAYLKAENFVPTKTADGSEPLLAQIIDDPEKWPTELTRRFTARLVYLERQAADLYAAREPDPELREESYTALMGATAHILQTTTYRYPTFTFSPSTAAENWAWRYVIPYEISWDLVEGDILATWQPTLALSENNLVNMRASLGFAGGLFRSSSNKARENYLGLGLGYLRRTDLGIISSVGITPTWYHRWNKPTLTDQDTLGGDINVSFLHDRLRVGFGTRDIKNFNNEWFLTFGFMDLPGAFYWLSR